MEKSEFISQIYKKVGTYPRGLRIGQSIFTAVDELFGVARDAQFLDNVDCFYDDNKISQFSDCAWERYKIKQENETSGEV